jgi:primosomal protein N' (replication factor Y) (superfamily II helicase)
MADRSHPSDSELSLWHEAEVKPPRAPLPAADVTLDLDAPDLQSLFTYSVPPHLNEEAVPGRKVQIRIGRREALGYITARRTVSEEDPLHAKLRDLSLVLDPRDGITQEQLKTALWMQSRYVCDLITAIRCMAPAVMGQSLIKMYRVTKPDLRGFQVTSAADQAHIYDTLKSLGGEAHSDILERECELPNFKKAVKALVDASAIAEQNTLARPRIAEKMVTVYTMAPDADRKLTELRPGQGQKRVIELFTSRLNQGAVGALQLADILAASGAGAASVKSLTERGILEAIRTSQRRSPYAGFKMGVPAPVLSSQQRAAASEIQAAIEACQYKTQLLFGVTASGKTEVYLDAIAHALKAGRTAIVLVPEIALTAQVVEIFVGRFSDQVAVLHSRLSDGERHDEWRRIQQGEARIVVGARSAIFAPVQNIGLIILDEEHEASYKQENHPRYNAREVAAYRAAQNGAVLLLGSATPSVETFWHTHNKNANGAYIQRIEMPERIDNRPLPHVEVIDLRAEFKIRRALFSERLAEAIGHRLKIGQQTILFLNRRGYSQFVLCRDCGWTAKCSNCAVSLTYHSGVRSLKCHHCGLITNVPPHCPTCRGSNVRAFGVGTEKVEEEVLKLYPSARVARMDRDTTARKGEHARILKQFREEEADVLIGTQMVAKGLDFPSVTLVGVISADTSINMPDFRAAERTFQLLTQVAGRAGRGQNPGEVIIQTFSPEHYAVQAAVRHDYVRFYTQEIEYRKELGYPPYSRLVNLVCSAENETDAEKLCSQLAFAIRSIKPPAVELLGPSPAPLARLKNLYRYHVALRCADDTVSLADIVGKSINRLPADQRVKIAIDMDPQNMS